MTLTKNAFRQKCMSKIKNSSLSSNRYYKNALVNKKLMIKFKAFKNKKILFYYPLVFEANILKTLYFMRKKNEIFVPFMQGESFIMVPFRLPLKKNKFGIFESGYTLKKIKKIDIAIVPAVGVDGNLQRVGFGKGMYDRFFARLRKKPYTVFVQAEFCYTKQLVCDSYDVRCNLLITPKVSLVYQE